jgi:hypothetical protein
MNATITSTEGIIAIAAAAVALVALLLGVYLAFRLRSLLEAQRTLLGASGKRDLTEHALALQRSFGELREYVEEASAHVEHRVQEVERALAGAIANRALVRYDAYNEQSGRQSLSLALLDAERSGVVVTCIHHREQARVYAKQVINGRGELELSPEEEEAVRLATVPDSGPSAERR